MSIPSKRFGKFSSQFYLLPERLKEKTAQRKLPNGIFFFVQDVFSWDHMIAVIYCLNNIVPVCSNQIQVWSGNRVTVR